MSDESVSQELANRFAGAIKLRETAGRAFTAGVRSPRGELTVFGIGSVESRDFRAWVITRLVVRMDGTLNHLRVRSIT
jgi:hypothetical protein